MSKLRRFVPAVAILALALMASCVSGRQKYGCPNHLQSSSSAGLR
jgi:hypothetical protein